MKREIIETGDGSKTIHLPEINEQYHSKHGALQESKHVFIQMGWQQLLAHSQIDPIQILEIGFGTGLNCLLTAVEAKKGGQTVQYTGVEAYPVSSREWQTMDYAALLNTAFAEEIYQQMHEQEWEVAQELFPSFGLIKKKLLFQNIEAFEAYNLIYFDAFGARVQPELWTEAIFKIMYSALKINGILVTYAAKGSVRRAMQSVGFKVERLEGPPGKREMLRATKIE